MLFAWLAKASTTTLVGIDGREGEQRLSNLGLPPGSTSDFCLRYSAVGSSPVADFRMSEQDFLAWMKAKQWAVTTLSAGDEFCEIVLEDGRNMSVDLTVLPVRDYEKNAGRTVKRGYCYYWSKPGNEDFTNTIFYDLDEGRVYYTHTSY